MKRIFSRLGFFFGALFTQLFFSSSAFAALFSPPVSDVSVGYLGKLFGGVGSILSGPSQTVLGVIFNSFNAGVLTVGGLILSYSTFKAIVDTAHDGEPMGKKISQWIIMRTAVGVGVLVPNAVSGYSMLQVTMLWVIVQGVGLADIIWNQTLDYLNKGGVIYAGSAAGTGDIPYLDKVLAFGGDTSVKDQYNASLDQYVGSMSVLRANACMLALQDALNAQKAALKKDMAIRSNDYVSGTPKGQLAKNFVNSSISLRSTIYTDPKTQQQVISFPGNITENYSPQLGLAALNGKCGRFRWTWDNPQSGDAGSDYDYWAAKGAGLNNMVSSTETAARGVIQYVKNNLILETSDIDIKAGISTSTVNTLVDAAANYQDQLSAMRIAKANSYKLRTGATDKAKEFYADAKSRGWASAGGYYYDLIKVQRQSFDKTYYQVWSANSVVPLGNNLSGKSDPIIDYPLIASLRLTQIDKGTTALNDITEALTTSFSNVFSWVGANRGDDVFRKEILPILRWNNNVYKPVIDQIDLFNAAQKEQWGIAGLDLKVLSSKVKVSGVTSWAGPLDPAQIVLEPLNREVNGVLGDWKSIMINSTSPEGMGSSTYYIGSPIEKLYYLGQSMIGHSVSIWQSVINRVFTTGVVFTGINTIMTTVVTALAPGSFWGATTGAQTAFVALTSLVDFAYKIVEMSVSLMMPLVLVVTGLLFTTGITLGIYVPLIPYMLFTFGIISWLVFVIEAMAAAPIVALGLMDPKSGNDELLGRAEPAQMLLLAVFLRPSVMLVGLITGTILSYVGVNVLNNTFGPIVASLSELNTLDATGMIKQIGVLFVYTFIMLALVNKCYETIYSIPDQIMQWIGAHTRASTDQQLLGEVKQGLGQVGQAGGEAGRGVSERAGAGVQAGRITPGRMPEIKKPDGAGIDLKKEEKGGGAGSNIPDFK